MSHDFTHEATTILQFASDGDFAAYRDVIRDRYSVHMVAVKRHKVDGQGRTQARVRHSRGLGAEVRGLAFGTWGAETLATYTENVQVDVL